jgi:hypothetical protein
LRVLPHFAAICRIECCNYKEQDISGKYSFTDTWVKRYGKWQAVASQATKVQQ